MATLQVFCLKSAHLPPCFPFYRSDDWIDRLNHVYTVFLLVIFAVVVSTSQFVGDPIHCWAPAHFTDAQVAYTKNFCWIRNTYFIPIQRPIPVDIDDREDDEIMYYQWIPIILLFQAFLFKLPNVLWKILNGGSGLNLDRICKMAEEAPHIPNMAFFLDRWLVTHRQYKHNLMTRIKASVSRVFCFLCNKREGNFLTGLYLTIKVLYLCNVVGQFFLLNEFMSTDYYMYGLEYIDMLTKDVIMRESPRFPRITLCDFRLRQLQNIQRWTVQCVLPVNLFNEKIFIFLWFWLCFLFILSFYNLMLWLFRIVLKRNNYQYVKKYLTTLNRSSKPPWHWLFRIVLKRNNYQYVKKYLTVCHKLRSDKEKRECRRFAEEYLRDDGCFVARMIGMNSTDLVITDLLDHMWGNYCKRRGVQNSEHTSENNLKDFVGKTSQV